MLPQSMFFANEPCLYNFRSIAFILCLYCNPQRIVLTLSSMRSSGGGGQVIRGKSNPPSHDGGFDFFEGAEVMQVIRKSW